MTDEEIVDEWRTSRDLVGTGRRVIAFARAIIAAERERCVKVCSDMVAPGPTNDPMVAGSNIALGEAVKRIRE